MYVCPRVHVCVSVSVCRCAGVCACVCCISECVYVHLCRCSECKCMRVSDKQLPAICNYTGWQHCLFCMLDESTKISKPGQGDRAKRTSQKVYLRVLTHFKQYSTADVQDKRAWPHQANQGKSKAVKYPATDVQEGSQAPPSRPGKQQRKPSEHVLG